MTEGKTINNGELKKFGLDDFFINCTFEACDFTGMKFVDTHFEDCIFKECNFSMVKLLCQLNDVQFTECKIVGTDFSAMSKFSNSFQFTKCNLSYVSFIENRLIGSRFDECSIIECDFSNADLTRSTFDCCDLSLSVFNGTNLSSANLATAHNFVVNPTINRINKMVISRSELFGLVAHLNLIVVD